MSVRNPQSIRDNPGGDGPGVPPLCNLLVRETAKSVRLLARGEADTARHRWIAAALNLRNYYLFPHPDGTVHCPCCGWSGPAFVAGGNWRAVVPHSFCPGCDSRSRHRGLVAVLPEVLAAAPPGPVLAFAPERVLMKALRKVSEREIVTTDLFCEDVDLPRQDIQRLDIPDESYAVLLCNHVLEHVPDDRSALRECARVLKPGGIGVFTIPGDYDGRPTRTFDQPDDNGHLRHYGLDVQDVIRESFSRLDAFDMSTRAPKDWQVRPLDYVFIAYK
jgi:hypothetical protein